MKYYTESELSSKILERIPPGTKPTDYLAEVLNLSRESVYRRLKGVIAFSFEEMLSLSTILDFSLDELLKGDKDEYTFFSLSTSKLLSAQDGFMNMYEFYSDTMEAISKAQNNHTTISANRILGVLASGSDNLFKFFYYKWLHQFGHTTMSYKFSDVQIPDVLNELRKKNVDYYKTQNMTFITDKNIIYNTIKEIKYYIDMKLINEEEALLIKKDLKVFIEKFFTFSMENILDKEIQYEVYISSLNIENNTSYVICDNKILSYFWTYSDAGIYTSNPESCMLQKNWLDSLKKYSILISNSNQKLQAELYNQFMDQLEALTE